MLCSFGSSTQGLVGPESGSVTAGKGDSFVRAGLLSVFDIGMLVRCPGESYELATNRISESP